jgi:hypothetical protein
MSQGRRSAGPLPAAGRGQGLVQRACFNHDHLVQARAPLPLGRASQVLPVPGGPLHEPETHKPRPPPQIHESPDMTRKDRFAIHLVRFGDS